MKTDCKNIVNHCKTNDTCTAQVLLDCKNKAIRCKTNDICIAWMLILGENNAFHCKHNIYIYIYIYIYNNAFAAYAHFFKNRLAEASEPSSENGPEMGPGP